MTRRLHIPWPGTPSKRLSVVLVRRGDCGSSKREAVDEEEAVRDERDLRGDDTLLWTYFQLLQRIQPLLLIYSFLLSCRSFFPASPAQTLHAAFVLNDARWMTLSKPREATPSSVLVFLFLDEFH
jgi:hypothetical protein